MGARCVAPGHARVHRGVHGTGGNLSPTFWMTHRSVPCLPPPFCVLLNDREEQSTQMLSLETCVRGRVTGC